MEIFIEKENKTKTIELKTKTQFKSILKKLNISLDSVILIKNDEICLEDELIENKDKLKILSVVSGG